MNNHILTTTKGPAMEKSTTFKESTKEKTAKELEYEKPELIEIPMLDESAVGFSGPNEPNPPG